MFWSSNNLLFRDFHIFTWISFLPSEKVNSPEHVMKTLSSGGDKTDSQNLTFNFKIKHFICNLRFEIFIKKALNHLRKITQVPTA